MRHTFADAASRDLDEIAASYASDNPDTAARFIAEVHRVMMLLLEHPLAGERIDDAHRHYPINGLPFHLNYRVDADTNCVRVIAVSDQRLRPGYWRNRVEAPVVAYEIALAA